MNRAIKRAEKRRAKETEKEIAIAHVSELHADLDLKAALVASRAEAAALREVVDGMAAELHEV